MDTLQNIRQYLVVTVCMLAAVPMLFCLGSWFCTSPRRRSLYANLNRQFRALPPGGKLLAVVLKGTNAVEGLHVSSSGTLSFGWPKGSPRAREMPDSSELDFLAPLQTSIGVAPPLGRFWHTPTSSNSLLLTWQDVYLNRDTNYPITFQSELFQNGDFTFRYGLDASSPCTNFTIGAQHNTGGETYAFGDTNRLVNGLELSWRAFGLLDSGIDDHDGDGLSTYDEVMLHGSDPRLTDSDLDGVTDGAEVTAGSNPVLRDTDGDGLIDGSDPDPLHATALTDNDGDGIPDAYETWRFQSTNVVNALTTDITTNGFLLAAEIAAGLDPHLLAAPLDFPADNLAEWQLCNPFAATFAGGTNLVYARTFRIDRAGGWQQYFVSASPNAPAGWSLNGMTLEWQDSGGSSGTATASPGDSLWLPVSTNGPSTLTLRLRATAAFSQCPQPLYLLVWAPGILLAGGTQATTNDVECTVINLKNGGQLTANFNRANRPCHAPPSAAELAATANPFVMDSGLDFTPMVGIDGAVIGGSLTAQTPGCRDLAQPIPLSALGDGTGSATMAGKLLAIWPILTWGEGLHDEGGCGDQVNYDSATTEYGAVYAYPLDSSCLWRNWWRDSTGGYDCTCEPKVSLGEDSLDDWFRIAFTYPEGDHVVATVSLGGTFIWSDEEWHQTSTEEECSEQGVELLSSDECGDCSGCDNGNCDGFEGPLTGSLAFRIPLGTPRQGQISGFLWFRTDEPLTITPAVFNLSARSDAGLLVESNNTGRTISHVNCDDERGRDLRIATMGNGVRITVSNALCTILEHTWEITNVGGMDYTPHAGDSSHSDDRGSPRTVTVHLVRNTVATVISRSWHIYTHGYIDGYAVVTVRTIRACTATAAIGDPGNAVTTETVFDSDAPGVPLLLRGRPASTTGEDGVTTTCDYALGSWDSVQQAFLPVVGGAYLRTVTRRSYQSNPFDTSHLTIQDATHGVTLHSATLLASDDTPLDWQTHAYDDKNRLRNTRYSDGSSSTNAYSCCRLLWTMDRDGNKILRSALTGSDHLYHAMEEVSLAELPRHEIYIPYENFQGGHRVTQHFMDALGRETNTVITAVVVPSSANVANCETTGPRTTETTVYPDGTSDYSIHTDRRGVRSVTWSTSYADREEHVTQTFHPTNLATHILLASNVTYRNGRSVSLKSWDGGWTRETFLTAYAADGCRRDIAFSEASDLLGLITNRLTHYDLLGRAAATLTPGADGTWLVTSNSYDGATSRVIHSETTGRPATTYLYDVLGEPVGTVQSGITAASETRHETISNEVWRVTVQSTSADCVTNAVTTTRQQLTGLSNALRSRTVIVDANGSVSTEAHVFDPETMELTVTRSTDDATPTIGISMFGRAVSRRTLSEAVDYYFDPLGRVYYLVAYHPVTDDYLYNRWSEFDDSGNEVYHDAYYGDLFITGSKTFDAFNRETSRTDALGNTVTTVYDALGRPVAADGATYPTLTTYDTAGRMKALGTTRDGTAWDTTQWHYDPTSGLVTNKVYADSTGVSYTHTPDGKPARTTWARGIWREYAYDGRGQPATVTYSDTTPAGFLTYDAIGYPTASSNAVAQYAYANSALGAATNEVAVIGTNAFTLTRRMDGRQRPATLSVGGQLHAAYTYDAENRLSVVSNDAYSVGYAFANDGLDAGYTVSLTNGTILSRAVTRDPYRRHLVAAITNAVGQSIVSGYCYVYDLLGRAIARNADTFDYNDRSEVTAAFIEPSNTSRYEYDGIGNNRWTTVNGATNTYSVNALNQYTNIANGATIVPSYDMDGNMLTNGVWSYTWDAENRLSAVYSNAALVVSNAYDPMSRRVLKITPTATHTFVYDGWNLAQETIATASGVTTNRYVWGKDLSGTMQGAGGVGGLLAVSLNGPWYFPFYDNNGNITAYVAESGNLVAEYVFDAFERSISQSGPMANVFSFRFSTKYFDTATGLYYYGYRFYSPQQGRWINRDPIDEEGGVHLYAFCFNHSINGFDLLGLDSYLLFWGDEDGVPFQQAAIGKKSQIEASRGFNSKTDQIVIIAARSFNDIQNSLKQNKCIKEIHFYVHAGPGIMFLDMTSQANDSNVSINGGTHTIRESDFVIKYKTRGVKELDSSNMKKFKKWQIFSKNKVYVHGCNSSSIANSLGKHLNASGDGVDGTCYYPIVNGVPIPATGR